VFGVQSSTNRTFANAAAVVAPDAAVTDFFAHPETTSAAAAATATSTDATRIGTKNFDAFFIFDSLFFPGHGPIFNNSNDFHKHQ
jgi:hypothetical protein